ncbi:COBW domain-containing protein 1-like [Canna indica]|uniref:COBW domain-containing protein 1-like n=1 Tax=Canna indica TaxID=4628 RepID=A0AAQ3JS44_9LILI|nr:COBW domain-containing protein 1-like [Canna indica]
MTNAECLGVLQLTITRVSLQLDIISLFVVTKAMFSRVIETFCVDELVAQHVKFDGIVTLVDCKHAMQHLNEVKPRYWITKNKAVLRTQRSSLVKVLAQSF